MTTIADWCRKRREDRAARCARPNANNAWQDGERIGNARLRTAALADAERELLRGWWTDDEIRALCARVLSARDADPLNDPLPRWVEVHPVG